MRPSVPTVYRALVQPPPSVPGCRDHTELPSPSDCSFVPTWGAHSYSLPPFLSGSKYLFLKGRHSWEGLICNLTSVHHQPAVWSVYRLSALSAVSPCGLSSLV